MAFGHRASRKQTYALVGLTGHSGMGKTYSALRMAKGLANGGPIGMIDTENGRGEMYGDEFEYNVESISQPFTPNKYSEAIMRAQAAGIVVLITDSFSHEWEGIGGVLEVHDANKAKGQQAWNIAKAPHKRLVNTMLQSRMHNIICMRGKDELIVDGKDYIKTGIVKPIQDSRFDYEMTLSLIMTGDGSYKIGKNCPSKLRPYFDGRCVTEDSGRHLLAWLKEGKPELREEGWLRDARMKAGEGSVAFAEFWKSIGTECRGFLKQHADELKTIKEAADDAMQVDPNGGEDEPPQGATNNQETAHAHQ